MAAKVAWNSNVCKTTGVKVNAIIDEVLELSQFKIFCLPLTPKIETPLLLLDLSYHIFLKIFR